MITFTYQKRSPKKVNRSRYRANQGADEQPYHEDHKAFTACFRPFIFNFFMQL